MVSTWVGRRGIEYIPLKAGPLMIDVGAPLIFEVIADIEMADVDVAEVEFGEDLEVEESTDEDPELEGD